MKWKLYQFSCLTNITLSLGGVILIVCIALHGIDFWILFPAGIAAISVAKNLIGIHRYRLMMQRAIPSDLGTAIFYFLWFANLLFTLFIMLVILIDSSDGDQHSFFNLRLSMQVFLVGRFVVVATFAYTLYGDILLERRLSAIEKEVNDLLQPYNSKK